MGSMTGMVRPWTLRLSTPALVTSALRAAPCEYGRERDGHGGRQCSGHRLVRKKGANEASPSSLAEQRRDHTPSIVLRCPQVLPVHVDPLLRIGLSLWGRRAVEHQNAAVHAMERTGRRGLLDMRGRVSFGTRVREMWTGRLGDWPVRAGRDQREQSRR